MNLLTIFLANTIFLVLILIIIILFALRNGNQKRPQVEEDLKKIKEQINEGE